MPEFTENHISILLAQMVRSQTIVEAAKASRLNSTHIYDRRIGGNPAQAVLFDIILNYHLENQGAPDDAVLLTEIRAFIEKYCRTTEKKNKFKRHVGEFMAFKEKVDHRSEAMARKIVQKIAQVCVFQPAAKEMLQGALESGVVEGLGTRICELEAQQSAVTGGLSQSGLVGMNLGEAGERVPTHIPWFDARTSGGRGPVNGSLLGIVAPQGSGKCLAPGTLVRMYDGSVKPVEKITDGDIVMGPGTQPRVVTGTSSGRGPMFRIKPRWFDAFECNWCHILTLVNTTNGTVVDIPLDQYLKKSEWFKSRHLLFRTAVEYPEAILPADPYFIGLWLGDGHSSASRVTNVDAHVLDWLSSFCTGHELPNSIMVDPRNGVTTFRWSAGPSGGDYRTRPDNWLFRVTQSCRNDSGDKFIPQAYLRSSRDQRMRLLAGIIDTDGYRNGKYYEVVTKFQTLAEGLKELVLSLGFSFSLSDKVVKGRTYYHCAISGEGLHELPVLVERRKIPDTAYPARYRGNRSRFEVEELGEGDYYGFCLNGDGRFLLADYTVTHNTTWGIQLAVSLALVGKHALLALAEEGLSQSVRNKILGCALGIDYTLFEQQAIRDIVREKRMNKRLVAKKLAMLDQHLHVLDMVNKGLVSQGAAPIIGEIEQMRSEGRKPSYVYVDWAGIIARAVASAKGTDNVNAEIQNLQDALTAAAQRANNIIAISQQMATEVVKKGPFNLPDMYCAADCRQFCQTTKYSFAINKQDPRTGYSLLTWVKTRDDAAMNTTQIVHLRGELACFQDISEQYQLMGRKIVSKRPRSGGDGQAPRERPGGGA